jgi:hypothetical protein
LMGQSCSYLRPVPVFIGETAQNEVEPASKHHFYTFARNTPNLWKSHWS